MERIKVTNEEISTESVKSARKGKGLLKRLTAALLALTIMVTAAGCGKADANGKNNGNDTEIVATMTMDGKVIDVDYVATIDFNGTKVFVYEDGNGNFYAIDENQQTHTITRNNDKTFNIDGVYISVDKESFGDEDKAMEYVTLIPGVVIAEEQVETEQPEVTEKPEETEQYEVTEKPEETEQHEVTEKPEETEQHEVTEKPEETVVVTGDVKYPLHDDASLCTDNDFFTGILYQQLEDNGDIVWTYMDNNGVILGQEVLDGTSQDQNGVYTKSTYYDANGNQIDSLENFIKILGNYYIVAAPNVISDNVEITYENDSTMTGTVYSDASYEALVAAGLAMTPAQLTTGRTNVGDSTNDTEVNKRVAALQNYFAVSGGYNAYTAAPFEDDELFQNIAYMNGTNTPANEDEVTALENNYLEIICGIMNDERIIYKQNWLGDPNEESFKTSEIAKYAKQDFIRLSDIFLMNDSRAKVYFSWLDDQFAAYMKSTDRSECTAIYNSVMQSFTDITMGDGYYMVDSTGKTIRITDDLLMSKANVNDGSLFQYYGLLWQMARTKDCANIFYAHYRNGEAIPTADEVVFDQLNVECTEEIVQKAAEATDENMLLQNEAGTDNFWNRVQTNRVQAAIQRIVGKGLSK